VDRGRGYNRTARKLLHIVGGTGALALPYIPYWLALAAAAGGMALALLLRPRHAWWLRVLAKPADRIRGVITGVRGYCAVILLLIVLWPLLDLLDQLTADSVRYVMFGWLALALGDGLAGLVGPGPSVSVTVPWSRQKTWWGMLACYLGVLAAYLAAFAVPWPGTLPHPLSAAWEVAIPVAVVIALLESLATPVDDNYIVGIGSPLLALALGILFL